MRKYKVKLWLGYHTKSAWCFRDAHLARGRLKSRYILMPPTLGRKGPLKFGHQTHYYCRNKKEIRLSSVPRPCVRDTPASQFSNWWRCPLRISAPQRWTSVSRLLSPSLLPLPGLLQVYGTPMPAECSM